MSLAGKIPNGGERDRAELAEALHDEISSASGRLQLR
jgi:hypothetical protein